MWQYENVTRKEFEKVKDTVEEIMQSLCAEKYDIRLPYEDKTTTVTADDTAQWTSHRSVYRYDDEFFRIGEVLFNNKPFIVIEFGTHDDLLKNTMEDAEPFPFDLAYTDLVNEVKWSLGIEPYPDDR